MKIETYIPSGSSAAVTVGYLAKLLNVERREVERAIQFARQSGVPICASNAEPFGVFIAETPEELARYCGSLDRRMKNMAFTRLALGDTLAEMEGQQTIEGA